VSHCTLGRLFSRDQIQTIRLLKQRSGDCGQVRISWGRDRGHGDSHKEDGLADIDIEVT
jgi:hypothetical protein